MKKFLSLFFATILFFDCFFVTFSVSPRVPVPVMTVNVRTDGAYGYTDYTFVDENGNNLELLDGSFVPSGGTANRPSVSLFSSRASTAIPSSFDAREAECVTPVKYQGNSGNCWAFATMSMLESDAILNGMDDIDTADYSEAHFSWFTSKSLTSNVADPTYGDGRDEESPFYAGGNWLIAAGSLARWTGAAENVDYPFSPVNLSLMGNYDESCRYDRGSGVIIKSAEELTDMNDAKQWIMDHGSATLAFYFEDAYYQSETFAYFYNGNNTLNHEITVIGWNDSFSSENFVQGYQPPGNGAWLCKNSWSTQWGDGGYFWISYYDTSIEQFAGISAQPAGNFYRNYTYNGAGWESYIGHTGSAKISNVFTAKENELLTAVSTYTMLPGHEINVSIYKNLPSGYTNPTQGNLVYTYSTALERAGYHTIDLETEILLESGTIFSVVIEFATDSSFYIPLEANTEQGMNAYSSNACESYVYLPYYNDGWYDAMVYGFNNVFVQAFTRCDHVYENRTTNATCDTDGLKINECIQCGKVSQEVISALGHSFSEWSVYVHDFETDREISTRKCAHCGLEESRSIFYAKNVIMLDDFLEMIWERFIFILEKIFG